MPQPFFTIGHSTRSIAEFVDLLRSAEIRLLVDVRAIPRSRTNPQYNRDTLPAALGEFQIDYRHSPMLGGLRGRIKNIAPEVNAFWKNQSFHNFADYALTEGFRSGLAQLRTLGQEQRCAIMCSEAVWWQCHRRIIADHLIAAGEAVFHIMAERRIEPARLTESATVGRDGSLTYPASAQPALL
jgi:uncharacterized protein (DUF488 family)